MVQAPSFQASGNINRSRFVDISGANTVAQSGVGSAPVGVSQRGAQVTPQNGASSLAAAAGDNLAIYTDGEQCLIEAGAAVTVASYVKPGANGVALPIVGGEAYYGQALEAASASGELVRCLLRRGVAPRPTVTIASAGSTTTDAAVLAVNTDYEVTGADATKGVRLPDNAAPGTVINIYSSAATNALKVYPPTGGTLNNGSADASINAAARTPKVARCISALAWTLL